MSSLPTTAAVLATNGTVHRWNGSSWQEIHKDAVSNLYGGGFTLLATPASNGDVKTWTKRNSWIQVGGPGAKFGVTSVSVYGLSPNKDAVFKWNNEGQQWTKIGGPAKDLIAGGFNSVFGISPDSGDIYRWISGDKWEKVGGPGSEFVVDGAGGLYGLSPKRDGIFKWSGAGQEWTKVGGPASRIFAGGLGVFALNPENTEIRRYAGSGTTWDRIGGGGVEYAVADNALFGLNSSGQVYKWSGSGEHWDNLNAPTSKRIVASP